MSDQECLCPYVGATRDPFEPHMPSVYEQEWNPDCPVHPPSPEAEKVDLVGALQRSLDVARAERKVEK